MKNQNREFARKFTSFGSSVINVNIIVDTDKILAGIDNHEINPSMDPNNPTLLPHNYHYMVASGSAMKIEGSGSGDLSFEAAQGDVVRFTGISEYNQFRSSVVLYDMFYISGDKVFQDDSFDLKQADDVNTPIPTSFDEFNVTMVSTDFYWAENSIRAAGTEFYGLRYAFYQLVRGEAIPKLIGFFGWDPKIVVQG